MKKDSMIFLQHILESIINIEDFSKSITKEKLAKDILKQSAIIRQIEIIGEASKNLPKELTAKHSSVPWKDIIGMRDRVIHQYFDIDIEVIWGVISNDLPDLKKKLIHIISQENKK